MTATVADPPRPQRPPQRSTPRRRRRRGRWLLLPVALVLVPVVVLAGAGNPPCDTATGGLPSTPAGSTPAGGTPAAGMFATPLHMKPDHWYRVGATEYGGAYGGSGAYLPSYPDSFAELSLLDANPYPNFTFADANALSNLPYGTAIRVANGSRQKVLVKRDVGYGQGPGQAIPYRVDVYGASAPELGVSKTPVQIELAPASGTGASLGQLPAPTTMTSAGGCATGLTGPLALTPGQTAQILANGDAAAPQAVKAAIAAANQIHAKPYSILASGAAEHFGPLAQLWPAYDCSGTVSYVLYKAGLHSINADVSGTLEGYRQPGPGRWITVYANSTHTWIVIAGLAFDTANYGGPNIPAGSGPRWRQNPTGNLADGLSYVVRHPPGL